MLRCMNCGLSLEKNRNRKYATGELELPLQNILAQWLSLPKLPDNDFICIACFGLLNNDIGEENSTRKLGHLNVCIGCGCSTLRKERCRTVEENSPFLDIYVQPPYHMKKQTYQVCSACWWRGHRKLAKQIKQERESPVHVEPLLLVQRVKQEIESTDLAEQIRNQIESSNLMGESATPKFEELLTAREDRMSIDETCLDPLTEKRKSDVKQNNTPSESIVLRTYKRAASTSRNCIFNDICKNKTRKLVPKFMKLMCLKKYNFYIPKGCRVCEEHIISDYWKLLPTLPHTISMFSVDQLEDLISLVKTDIKLDFEHVHAMPDHICEYWTGLNVAKFTALYNDHKHILDKYVKEPKTSLAAYLTRIQTGDSHTRLGKLFQMSRTTVERRMKYVDNFITEHNVQLNIPQRHSSTKPNQSKLVPRLVVKSRRKPHFVKQHFLHLQQYPQKGC